MTSGLIKKPAVRAVLFVLTAAVLFFIFYMSAFDAEESSEISSGLLTVILNILSPFGIGDILTEHILRKLAHFTEYFVLGALLFADVEGFGARLKVCLCLPLPLVLLTAATDELSQFLSAGRTPMARDVFIDLCGGASACFILFLIIYLKNKKAPSLR